MRQSPGTLWAITCFYNPAGYKRRIANYRVFRAHLAIPLVAVELSFDGHFELQREDADILVQIRGDSVLWQKERLLNIALTHVPASCRKIAWIDCDVIFASNDWAERADRALDDRGLVHLFQERHDLPRDVGPDRLSSWDCPPTAESALHKLAAGTDVPANVLAASAPLARRSTVGLAWASPRAVIEKHGFYDACILGSGVGVILCAALGEFSHGARWTLMNTRQAEHYLQWARPYYATIRGRVGYIHGRLFHLWHGAREERLYQERHRGLEPFAFDPFTDIAPAPSGCWQWNTEKPEMHTFIERYFTARNEDGRLTGASIVQARR